MLRNLEEDNLSTDAVMCEDERMCELALYVQRVFESKMNFDSEAIVGKFLHYKLKDTPYLSKRGEKISQTLDSDYYNKKICHLQ